MKYSSSVNYALLDPVKVLAQMKARETASQFPSGMQEVAASRGESAYVWETPDSYLASVVEGLGTKNLVADAMETVTNTTYYDRIAKDTVAAIVNDIIVVGAKPLVISAYFAVGDSNWFENKKRAAALVTGWADACRLSGVVWGGGETPTLRGVVMPQTIDLGGSCIGIIQPKNRLVLGDKLTEGDAIVLFESNGIHANGLTLAREIASKLPKGYHTPFQSHRSGGTYGTELLQPTIIYAKLVQDLFAAHIDIHYMVNITGHGWRKIMRATKEFSYVIDALPTNQPLFDFIQKTSGTTDAEMYGTFNMGAGFAVFVPEKDVEAVIALAQKSQIKAHRAGRVENGPKQVVIKPKDIVFTEDSLQVRA